VTLKSSEMMLKIDLFITSINYIFKYIKKKLVIYNLNIISQY